MHPTKKAARIAGFIYLSMVVTAPFSLIYVPSKLIVRGNAAAKINPIQRPGVLKNRAGVR